jgi:hypothetical protein
MPLLRHVCGISKTDLVRGMEDTVAQALKWGVGTGKVLAQELF